MLNSAWNPLHAILLLYSLSTAHIRLLRPNVLRVECPGLMIIDLLLFFNIP